MKLHSSVSQRKWLFTLVSLWAFATSSVPSLGRAQSEQAVASPQAEGEAKYERAFPLAPNGKLFVNNFKGRISVEGWDREQVVVDVYKVFEGSDEDRKWWMAKTDVTFSSGPKHLDVDIRYPNHSWLGWDDDHFRGDYTAYVQLTIHAPRRVNVELSGYKPEMRVALEWQIVQIWEELLEVRPIGAREDFFELGGDSLLAVRMMDRVEMECGARPPVSALFGGATVEHLAKALLDANRVKFRSPLVNVQAGASRQPFFFLHGDYNGGGFYCRNLAQRLGKEQTFFAILPHGLDGEPIPQTIEAMAADRLRVLLEFQPSGPYLLGGHCNGGLVAFEMARQMRRMGLKVDLLVIVDASALNARYRGLRRLIWCLGFLLRQKHHEQVDWFIRARLFLIRLRELSEDGRRAQTLFVIEKMKNIVKKMFKPVKSRPREEASPSDSLNPREKDRAYRRAMEGYVPGPYGGRVVFLRTNSMQSRSPDDPTIGWSGVTSGVEVCPIPGDHLSCLTEHIDSLAQHLAGCLRAANPGPERGL